MATNYVRYVDVDADAGGDGTTSALTGANCAFKSLSLAEAAGDGAGQPPLNLTMASDTYTITCQSTHANHTADSTAVTVQGWTVSATSTLTIVAATASSAGTAWSASKYRLSKDYNTNTGVLYVANTTIIDGLQIENTGESLAQAGSTVHLYAAVTVKNCYFRQLHTGTQRAKTLSCAIAGSYILNTILLNKCTTVNAQTAALYMSVTSGTIYAYSCTIIGGYYCVNSSSASYLVTMKNCYGGNAAGAAYNRTTMTNCASYDTSAGSSNGCISNVAYSASSGAYFTSVTSGSEDLSLASASSTLYNAGTDTSGESAPLNFTTDIVGTSRPQSTGWDIGAHELVAASGHPAVKRMGGIPFASLNQGVW